MFKNFCNRLACAVAAVALVAVAAVVVGVALHGGVVALPLAYLALKGAAHFAKEAVKSSSTNESRWKPPDERNDVFTNEQREREWNPPSMSRR